MGFVNDFVYVLDNVRISCLSLFVERAKFPQSAGVGLGLGLVGDSVGLMVTVCVVLGSEAFVDVTLLSVALDPGGLYGAASPFMDDFLKAHQQKAIR